MNVRELYNRLGRMLEEGHIRGDAIPMVRLENGNVAIISGLEAGVDEIGPEKIVDRTSMRFGRSL